MTPPTISPINGTPVVPHCGSPIMSDTGHYTPVDISKILREDSDQFNIALAHEMRNPLTNINLSVKLLESAIKDDALKVYLDIIMRSSIQMNKLIKIFLKEKLVDKGPEKLSIHHLLDDIIEMTEDRIKLKNISVSKHYAVRDFEILLDEPKMKIALANIIINAIDSMDSKKGELKLTTRLIDDKCIVYIEDNGCGISERHLTKIFNPYFTNKADGLGIGLATTLDTLTANHIDVKVQSKPNQGTRFILSFEQNKSKKLDDILLVGNPMQRRNFKRILLRKTL